MQSEFGSKLRKQGEKQGVEKGRREFLALAQELAEPGEKTMLELQAIEDLTELRQRVAELIRQSKLES